MCRISDVNSDKCKPREIKPTKIVQNVCKSKTNEQNTTKKLKTKNCLEKEFSKKKS